jgi:hypothetical protein
MLVCKVVLKVDFLLSDLEFENFWAMVFVAAKIWAYQQSIGVALLLSRRISICMALSLHSTSEDRLSSLV